MKRVLLPRPIGRDDDVELLSARGYSVTAEPYIEVSDLHDERAVADIVEAVRAGADLVLTSSRGLATIEPVLAQVLADTSVRAFAVGPTTAEACRAAGIKSVITPTAQFDMRGLLEALAEFRPASVAIPRSGAASDEFLAQVLALEISVTSRVTYDTRTVAVEPASLADLRSGAFAAVVVRSGSAARALAEYVPAWPAETLVVASGAATAAEAQRLGLPVAITSQDSTSERVVEAVAAILG